MESLCRLCGIFIFVVFGLLDTSYARPIDGIGVPPLSAGGGEAEVAWLAGALGPALLAVAALVAVGGVALVGCCACCRRQSTKGFQEFTDSGSSHSLSTGGYVNPAVSGSSPATEFTIFPPAPSAAGSVSFEPLPDIRPRQTVSGLPDNSAGVVPPAAAAPSAAAAANQRRHSQRRPAAFNNAVSHDLTAQDWFDNPHGNFPRSQLKYLCEFGKGWFGRVVEGEALGLDDGAGGIAPTTRVIVKILHGDATPTDQMYFLHEVRYLKDLTPHPNILQFKGRCLETDPFLIILEACPTGDLKTFLLQNLATCEALSMQGVILKMACNIAAGLQHIHEQGFVHTDLAARNCLVASDLTVKIGDYGTSIENFKDDYYCAGDVALPIRWCAPETLHCTDTTIETKEVTAAANIWSFGILLWELCEFGCLPYSELNDEEVIIKVLSEKILHLNPPSRPSLHSDSLYHLMRLCWNCSHRRPRITQVAAMLNNLLLHPEEVPSWSFEDFELHWAATKPNSVTAVVETIVHNPPSEMQQTVDGEGGVERSGDLDRILHRSPSPSPHPSLHGEPLSPNVKHKSLSLQNLHGSLEDLVESSCSLEDNANKNTSSSGCELDTASCDIPLEGKSESSWLHYSELHGVTEDDEDAQFVKKISEAIRDLDDVLALEKTSSSSGSGTSPEEHSPTKKRFVQLTHEKVDENGVLDFRLENENGSKGICKSPVNSTGDVTKENIENPSAIVMQEGRSHWQAESVSEGLDNHTCEKDIGENENSSKVSETVVGIACQLNVPTTDMGADSRHERPKITAIEEEEEEEEMWRKRLEMGEFSAKVREKSRSVQDLMVLTHIEESSEGSDSEGGAVTNSKGAGSPPPPGPKVLQGVNPPSFGSVGDLRRAVLGEDFRHTLERLCAANKKDLCGSPTTVLHSKLLEESEDKRINSEVSGNSNEHLNTLISSQNNEIGVTVNQHHDSELTSSIAQPCLAQCTNSSLTSSPVHDSCCDTHTEKPTVDSTKDVSDENKSQELQNTSNDQNNYFPTEICEKPCDIMTSTPIMSSLKNSSAANENSFLLDLVLDSATSAKNLSVENYTHDTSVSSVDPTFQDTELSMDETEKIEINCSRIHESVNSEDCDCNQSVSLLAASFKVSGGILGVSSFPHSFPKATAEGMPLEKSEICNKGTSSTTLIEIKKIPDSVEPSLKISAEVMEFPSDSLLSHERKIISPLSVLAMNCLSSYHHKQFDENDFSSKLINKITTVVDNKDALCLTTTQSNDGRNIDCVTQEKYLLESPLSEFPGELEEQSPVHALTRGISGSQSTVECRSPLALSPVTVGVDDSSITRSASVLSSQQEPIQNDVNSSCEEKFKNDGVTKEINSDFIFTLDPSVENMDAVIKPDLLLDAEKVMKDISLGGSKLPSDLIDHSNINFQDNVVEALITNIEANKNYEISWIKSDAINKGNENSHILLDLVQINPSKIQNSSSDSMLCMMEEPIHVSPSLDEKYIYPLGSEFSPAVKDVISQSESQDVDQEVMTAEKDNLISDAPNSEECDSAGTEDSVFDLSPPAPDSNNEPIKMDSNQHPQVKEIRCLQKDQDGSNGFGNKKTEFESLEVKGCPGKEEVGLPDVEQHRDGDDEDEELVLMGTKQWTPDDERSSDSGFRDKGSLSESVEDACERCDLVDVETVAEQEEEEMDLGGEEASAEGNVVQGNYVHCACSGELIGEELANGTGEVACANGHEENQSKKLESSSHSCSMDGSREQEEFWRQQMASLRQAANDTASLIHEASAPVKNSSWTEGETWDEDIMGSAEELKIATKDDDVDRGLDEVSLAALRSELQEKLGGNNCRFGVGMEAKHEDGIYEGTNSEERVSEEEDEDEDDREEVSEERADITIHYDAYLAQLSPILEERESVGSSEMYSPATKEPPRDSGTDDSATTASVNDIVNQVFLPESNVKDPVLIAEDVLVVDTSTNQSFMVSSPADFHESGATSPEFSDSLEDDDNEENEKSDKNTPKETCEADRGDILQKNGNPVVRCAVPPSDFWTGIPSLHSWNGGSNLVSNSDGTRPSPPRSPLLLPPPPSSAPMPSPEEERAGCVERTGSKNIPIFRDFEDIVALCQKQGDDFTGCNYVNMEELHGEIQRSSEETEISIPGTTQNLQFWESESSDGNDSSSSGEFVWKEGERDVPQDMDASALEPVTRVYESLSEFPMAVIEEEDEEEETCEGEGNKDDGASDSSGSIMEFIPSVWNSAAEPSHSSLRSPDRKSDQKKNVSFKRQKYHCVYEYPKEEASDSESECQDSPTRRQWNTQPVPPFDYSSYADWELMEGDIPEGIIPSEIEVESELPVSAVNHRHFDFYKLSSEDYDFGFAVSPESTDGEFMVSSSSRPFQYCAPDPSFSVGSQFFPGLNLTAGNVPGWVAGRRSSWSKNSEENLDLIENVTDEGKVEGSVPDFPAENVLQDSNHGEITCGEKVLKSGDGGSPGWCSQQPLPSPIHSSSSSASLSSCSPPASPLSPTGLGELRHTRDRLKLNLPHKFSLRDVSQGKVPKKDEDVEARGAILRSCDVRDKGSIGNVDDGKELKVRRRAEEQKGEASLLDVEREKEGITKTAL